MVSAIGSGHVGNIPYGIGSCSIQYRTSAQGISVPTYVLGSISLQGIAIVTLPGIGGLVPQGGIQGHIGRFCFPLGGNIIICNGVEQSCSIYADGRLQADLNIVGIFIGRNLHVLPVPLHIDRCIVCRCRNGHLWVGELVTLAILKLVSPFVGVVAPFYLYLRFIYRSLEGLDGTSLRHTCYRTDIGIGLLIIDDQQITIALQIGRIGVLPGTMSISRMAIQASRTHIYRSQSRESAGGVGIEIIFKQILAFVEGRHHARIFYGCSRLLEGRGRIVGGGSQLSSSKILFRVVNHYTVTYFPGQIILHIVSTGCCHQR